MVCKSTGEINYNCVGVGRSTKTSRRRFLKRICPKTNLPSKAKYPRHSRFLKTIVPQPCATFVRTAESCQTLRNFPNTSGTFKSDESSTMLPCSYFRSALWNLSTAEQPSRTSNRRTFAKPNISGALQYLQNAPQLFLIQLS